MPTEQDFSQGEVYRSSRYGDMLIREMALPHVENALRKLLTTEGAEEIVNTPLIVALAERAKLLGLDIEPRAVPFGDPDGAVIRGNDGRFKASVSRARYRQPRSGRTRT